MSWWHRKSREDDLSRELGTHLDLEAEEHQSSGLGPEEARFAALRAFGNRTTIQEDTRMTWQWISMDKFTQDLRYAGRMASKNPIFAALAILTLALGIGANTAIFSVVDAVLLRPLPYRDAGRLVRVETRNDPLQIHSGPTSFSDFLDWRASGTFEDAGIYYIGNSLVRFGSNTERLPSAASTASLFSTLGVQPLLGRLPLPAEDQPGASPVTLLSESLWRNRYAADPSMVGRSIQVDGKPSVVVGVLPASFVFERDPALWTTFSLDENLMTRQNRFLAVLARLRTDDSIRQADAKLTALCSHLSAQYPGSNKGWSANAFPWQESMTAPVRPELLVLLGAVCLVLFICCGNVAMLLLVRGIGRTRELGLRIALGASRPRIAMQLLTENLLLSLIAGGLGAALAAWCVSLFVRYGPHDIPRLAEVHVDTRVLIFALALAILTPLVFGLGPALQLSKPDVNTVLQEGGKSTSGRRRALLRTGFLVTEMALSLVLLSGAGLLVKSFLRLASVEPGFRPDRLLTFQLELPSSKYLADGKYLEARVAQYYQQVFDRLERLPDVESAAGALDIPMVGGGYRSWGGFRVLQNPATAISKTLCVRGIATSHYFRALGIPLKIGREFNERDNKTAQPPVAMVNETFARKYLAGLNPIGQNVQLEGAPTLFQIVGVVGDVKPDGLDSGANPEIYGAYAQAVAPFLMVAVRAKGDPARIIPEVRNQLLEIDRDVPPYRFRTGEQVVSLSLAERRFSMALVALFALLALLLAAIGLYGVVSYTVTQSTREIGIRIALGAKTRDVFLVALRQGLAPSLVGLALGLALSMGLTPLMSRLLFEVRPLDAGVFAMVSAVLLAICGLACTAPARRATRVDPVRALRYE